MGVALSRPKCPGAGSGREEELGHHADQVRPRAVETAQGFRGLHVVCALPTSLVRTSGTRWSASRTAGSSPSPAVRSAAGFRDYPASSSTGAVRTASCPGCGQCAGSPTSTP